MILVPGRRKTTEKHEWGEEGYGACWCDPRDRVKLSELLWPSLKEEAEKSSRAVFIV